MAIPVGFPDASTTGIPAGTTLTPYSGPTTFSTSGATISGKIINSAIVITGNNITIEKCRITYNGPWGVACEGAGIIVQDCKLIGPGTAGAGNGVIVGHGTFLRNDISQSENGIVTDGNDIVIRDNYIHDLNSNAEPHYDGISVQGGQHRVLIEHNTVIARDTSCVFIKDDFGPIDDVTVRNNYLDGSACSYPVYVDGRGSGGPITNVTIENNVIVKGVFGFYSVDQSSPIIRNNTELLVPPTGEPPVADTITLTTVTIASPTMGTVSIVAGKLRYTVAAGYSGPVNGTYTITDGAGQTSTAAWSGTVSAPPNPPPLAVADNNAFTVPYGTVNVDIDVLANDFADAT